MKLPTDLANSLAGQYIAGKWRAGCSGKTLVNTNPFNSEILATMALADQNDLDEAYRAARDAQPAWAAALPAERSAVLLNAAAITMANRELLVDWLIRESGSTRTKAEMEVGAVHAGMIAAAGFPGRSIGRLLPVDIPGKESRVYREALGVVGVISPWNWPMHLSNRSIAPALALGNAVVVKPAEDTPVTGALLLALIYEAAGLPPGVLNVVNGDVADIGDAFTLHPIPKFISFTGSTRVGRHIGMLAMTGPTLKRVGLELGGNAPFVVLDDADIERAVHAAVVSRFLHSGQICMSANRLIVDSSIHDRFVEAFVERVRALKCGDPNDPDTVIGPLINRRQLGFALDRIEAAKAAGHRQVLGAPAQGQVLPPQVFIDVANDSALAQAEHFAPVAPIIRAQGEEEALTFANQTEFGLSSAVFTADEARGVRFARRIDAGMTHVNDITPNDDPNNMFGGEKNSGLGRFNSDWIIAELTTDHWVSVQHGARQYPF